MPEIKFGKNARPEAVSEQARQVLDHILSRAGISSCLITSTARTPEDQARAMYNNLEQFGVAHQKKLYAAAGDAVIEAYAAARRAGKSPGDIKLAMRAKIIELGPHRISRHCADPAVLVVVDVAPGSIANKGAFERAVRQESRVSNFLLPPDDPAYHLEIPQV